MILALSIIEVSEEQRVRVPSAKRTEYESQPSNAADFLPNRTRTQRSGTRTRRLFYRLFPLSRSSPFFPPRNVRPPSGLVPVEPRLDAT